MKPSLGQSVIEQCAPELDASALSPKKDQQALAELLLSIEAKFDVNAIKARGVHLWPLTRLLIGDTFKRSDPISDAGMAVRSPQTDGNARKTGDDGFPTNKAERAALRSRHSKAIAQRSHEWDAMLRREWDAAGKLRGTDFLVLSKVEKYYERIEGRRYAPILDPVLEDLRERGKAEMLALEPLPIECVNEPYRIDIAPYALRYRPRTIRPSHPAATALRDIAAYVAATNPGYAFRVEEVLGRCARVVHRSFFYAEILRRIEPKCVFLSSFTGWLPVLVAARRLGIPTVDVQHGGQGPIHHPTTHLSALPEQGYETMPDVFWLWGQMNLEYAKQWLPGKACRHIPVVGGNRKVARWYKRRDQGRLDARDQGYIDRFRGRPVFLITLSYGVDRLLPQPLVDAMRRVPEVEWHVRLHPIHRSPEAIAQIKAHLAASGCGTFFVEEPTEVQLPTALSVSLGHITPFSTSGTEAISMGVPSLVCHRIGARLFAEEINAGVIGFGEDSEGIEHWVRKALNAGHVEDQWRSHYVETDDGAVDNVIATALSMRRGRSFSERLRSVMPMSIKASRFWLP